MTPVNSERGAALTGCPPFIVSRRRAACSISRHIRLDIPGPLVNAPCKTPHPGEAGGTEQLTGMQVGGISVLGLKRPVGDVYIDERARGLETIHISAGERGSEIALRTADLVAISSATYVVTG